MSIDITNSHQSNSFPMPSDVPKGCNPAQPAEQKKTGHPKPESTEQQLLKYLRESNGAFYGHVSILLSRQHKKS